MIIPSPSCMSLRTFSTADFVVSNSINALWGQDNGQVSTFFKRELASRIVASTTSAFSALDFAYHLISMTLSATVWGFTYFLPIRQATHDHLFERVKDHAINTLQYFLAIFYGSVYGLIAPKNIPVKLFPRSEDNIAKVPVFMIHEINEQEDLWTITPNRLRSYLEHLRDHGYQLVTIKELSENQLQDGRPLDAAQKYAVLTFDDGKIGNFRYLDDGTIDPNCAVGILEQFKRENPAFRVTASFFVCTEDTPEENIHPAFGQAGRETEKLNFLIDNHYEVGSHGSRHVKMANLNSIELNANFTDFERQMNEWIGEDRRREHITSLCYPYGSIPCAAVQSIVRNTRGGHFERTVKVVPFGKANRNDRWNIPRIYVGPWSGFAEFAR